MHQITCSKYGSESLLATYVTLFEQVARWGENEIQCAEKTVTSMAESLPSIKAAECSGQFQANKEGSSAGVGISSGGY